MLKKYAAFLFIVSLLICTGCQNEIIDPETFQIDVAKFDAAQDQDNQNQVAEKEYQRAEKNLIRMLEMIKDKYRNNLAVIENINKSQEAWKEYRDFHLMSVFPTPDFQWGQVYTMSYSIEKARMTWLRVKELYKWVAPGKAGEAYPDPFHGSYGMYELQIQTDQ